MDRTGRSDRGGTAGAADADALQAAFANAESSEHVLLESDDVVEDAPPRRILREIELRDRARRTLTTLALREDGKLDLCRRQRGRVRSHCTIDLGYLDPEPTIERRPARRTARGALAAAAIAVAAGAAARLGAPGPAAWTVAGLATAAAAGGLLAFVHWSREWVVFRTRHGRAPALTLSATPGSRRAQRKAVPVIGAAIEQAREALGEETSLYLKREMREHYRLQAEGLLSDRDCADGTARVLARFDSLP